MATRKAVNIINVSSDVGSVYAGKSKAPAAFEAAGLREKLHASGVRLLQQSKSLKSSAGWTSSTREPNGARNEARTVGSCHQVAEMLANELQSCEPSTFQLILSGECLYCPAILSAYWKHVEGTSQRVGILYVDADCDLYTPTEPNASGNIAGMTLTHMTLRDGALDSMKAFSRPDGSGVVDNENIVLFGLNSTSEANKREHMGYLFDNNFRVITSQAIQRAPEERAKEALQWLESRVDQIVVHLDVDVIDPGEFPLCNVPNWTGLSFKNTMSAVKIFLKSEKCVAFSIAEVNPDHDPGLEMTGKLVDEIAAGLSQLS
ncbi:Arginase/deacetylase [Aaosphaeria arxii CBS 175.79]|uniref:Arginase/deacetylase n=1 Tax=Aaosphaeria arxii CBS 175.79 TaxID=1450172 RepID=A0A6A5XNH5_9PLEO|nr:Arginase/deacetylase [Aaosphaeria arxii CBS 175.79]KAF2014397.1 Arginase/deacetylase [Aaosphaeria arxii CBS 175.79]